MINRRNFIFTALMMAGSAGFFKQAFGQTRQTFVIAVPKNSQNPLIQNLINQLFGININFYEYVNVPQFIDDVNQGKIQIDLGIALNSEINRLVIKDKLAVLHEKYINNVNNLTEDYYNQFKINPYTIPALKIYSGLVYNRKKYPKVDSWGLIFDENNEKNRVGWIRHAKTMAEISMIYEKLEFKSGNLNNPKIRNNLVRNIKKNVQLTDFASTQRIIQDELDICIASSGTALVLAKTYPILGFAFPKEGILLDEISCFVPKKSKFQLEAISFIDFLLNPLVNLNLCQKILAPTTLQIDDKNISVNYVKNPYLFPDAKQIIFHSLLPDAHEYDKINQNYREIFS